MWSGGVEWEMTKNPLRASPDNYNTHRPHTMAVTTSLGHRGSGSNLIGPHHLIVPSIGNITSIMILEG